MKTEFRDRKHRIILHQLEHNKTVIKSNYEKMKITDTHYGSTI